MRVRNGFSFSGGREFKIMKKVTAKQIAKTALFAAVISIAAPFSVPIGAVPVSLATFAIFLAAGILSPLQAFFATLTYVLLGLIGVPVYSGFTAGAGVLFGVTGGYIIGYLLTALLSGVIINAFKAKGFAVYFIAYILGTAVLYAIGSSWHAAVSGADYFTSLTVTVLPFIIPDLLKAAAGAVIAPTVKKRLNVK